MTTSDTHGKLEETERRGEETNPPSGQDKHDWSCKCETSRAKSTAKKNHVCWMETSSGKCDKESCERDGSREWNHVSWMETSSGMFNKESYKRDKSRDGTGQDKYEKSCKRKKSRDTSARKIDDEDEDNRDGRRRVDCRLRLQLNGITVAMDVDSVSDITFLSEEVWRSTGAPECLSSEDEDTCVNGKQRGVPGCMITNKRASHNNNWRYSEGVKREQPEATTDRSSSRMEVEPSLRLDNVKRTASEATASRVNSHTEERPPLRLENSPRGEKPMKEDRLSEIDETRDWQREEQKDSRSKMRTMMASSLMKDESTVQD